MTDFLLEPALRTQDNDNKKYKIVKGELFDTNQILSLQVPKKTNINAYENAVYYLLELDQT